MGHDYFSSETIWWQNHYSRLQGVAGDTIQISVLSRQDHLVGQNSSLASGLPLIGQNCLKAKPLSYINILWKYPVAAECKKKTAKTQSDEDAAWRGKAVSRKTIFSVSLWLDFSDLSRFNQCSCTVPAMRNKGQTGVVFLHHGVAGGTHAAQRRWNCARLPVLLFRTDRIPLRRCGAHAAGKLIFL